MRVARNVCALGAGTTRVGQPPKGGSRGGLGSSMGKRAAVGAPLHQGWRPEGAHVADNARKCTAEVPTKLCVSVSLGRSWTPGSEQATGVRTKSGIAAGGFP